MPSLRDSDLLLTLTPGFRPGLISYASARLDLCRYLLTPGFRPGVLSCDSAGLRLWLTKLTSVRGCEERQLRAKSQEPNCKRPSNGWSRRRQT